MKERKKQLETAIKILSKAIDKLSKIDPNKIELDFVGMIDQMEDDLHELKTELYEI